MVEKRILSISNPVLINLVVVRNLSSRAHASDLDFSAELTLSTFDSLSTDSANVLEMTECRP